MRNRNSLPIIKSIRFTRNLQTDSWRVQEHNFKRRAANKKRRQNDDDLLLTKLTGAKRSWSTYRAHNHDLSAVTWQGTD